MIRKYNISKTILTSKLKLWVIPPVNSYHHSHVHSVCRLIIFYPPSLTKLLKVLPKLVNSNQWQVVQFQNMKKTHKNRLQPNKMILPVFLVFNKPVVSWNEPAKMVLRMAFINLPFFRKHKGLSLLDFLIVVDFLKLIVLIN